MNWKKFFKPDWRKIAIFFVLLILTIFSVQACGQITPAFSYNLLFAPFYFYNILNRQYFDFYSNCDTSYIPLIFSTIYWYLLSCLIIWIYEKTKKKK
jgi:hypothetical protein